MQKIKSNKKIWAKVTAKCGLAGGDFTRKPIKNIRAAVFRLILQGTKPPLILHEELLNKNPDQAMQFGDYTNYYYLTILLQGICVWHSIKKGTQQKWIWIIILLPVIGAVAYIFTEIINKKDLHHVGSGVGTIINPGGRVKKLEAQLRFADTFQNRILLADELIRTGQTAKAIEMYEKSLEGNFAENEHVLNQLCIAYHTNGNFEKAILAGKKVYTTIPFSRSRAHIAYAQSLARVGDLQAAEAEFKKMSGRYSNFEARYYYGLLLKNRERTEDAKNIWNQIAEEGAHLSAYEKRDNQKWIQATKEGLKMV